MSRELLTIGMATRGEPDHVWFVLESLHAHHPRCDYLVVDNTPERDPRVEAVTRAVGGRYLHRPDLTGTSAPRDAVFRFARTPWAMCIDSHVLLEPGAVQAALDFIARNPDSRDILSGPIVWDDGGTGATHWQPQNPPGLWGTWALDERGKDPAGAPFEVPMMGLGLWLMRRAAWPGFHPAFSGFGGEEGYIHEKVRQLGGKALSLPALRWRHKFRDVSGFHNNPPPPYPLRAEDHAWNLLLGHRELGIEATAQIHEHIGKRLPAEAWGALQEKAATVQPFGGPRAVPKRQRILAVWYSDNTPPAALLHRSAASVVEAQQQTLRHDVTVSGCSWAPLSRSGDHLGDRWTLFRGERARTHSTIVAQIRQAVAAATAGGETFDAVAFCEHDVLYPPGYFDRLGDALAANPDAPGVVHLDYIGLNGTGWQRVRQRHEPLHQMCLRWGAAGANLDRAEKAAAGGSTELEPYNLPGWDRRVRLKPDDTTGMTGTPAVHVNRDGAFTNHGAVCFEPQGLTTRHAHWGDARLWWPGEMTAAPAPANQFKSAAPKSGGCSSCAARPSEPPAAPPTLPALFDAAGRKPSDFHEHVPTLRELAAGCTHVTELSHWYKAADAALASGVGGGTFVSVCPGAKPSWRTLRAEMGERFRPVETAPAALAEIESTDLLFIDTEHTNEALHTLLERHHARVAKYLVVHCTETFGEAGDRPETFGVLHALRTFCHRHPEWVVKRRDRNNHGLMVLSRCAEDVKDKPSQFRMVMNYTAAMAKHLTGGRKTVPLEVLESRQAECSICEERALDACAACGCPLEAKLPLATERCGLVKKGLPPKWDAWQPSAV